MVRRPRIARQRDLKELVGDFIPGAQRSSLADALDYMTGRFSVIKLEDRNLPAIVEKRLLAPKNEAARQLLEQAFTETDRLRPEVMSALLGRKGDRNAFRSVYPFSPALIDTLIAGTRSKHTIFHIIRGAAILYIYSTCPVSPL